MARKKLWVTFQYDWKTTKVHRIPFKPIVMELLETIAKTGSIASASKKVGTSFSNAWKELNEFEETIGEKVVFRDGQRGSELTEFGAELVADYKEFRKRVYEDDFFKKYSSIIL